MSNPEIREVVIIPGGHATPEDNWYLEAEDSLQQQLGRRSIRIAIAEMPSSYQADAWLSHMQNELKLDEHSIVIGHSSGAVAAMRYAEEFTLGGIVLVAAHHTHCGYFEEKRSGFFPERDWDWSAIKANNRRPIVQFGSNNDPLIPYKETEHIRDQLGTDYREIAGRGHYAGFAFPELPAVIKEMLEQ